MSVVIRDFEVVPQAQQPQAQQPAGEKSASPDERRREVEQALRHHAERLARIRAY